MKKNMKKLLALAAAGVLAAGCIALAGCGSDNQSSSDQNSNSTATAGDLGLIADGTLKVAVSPDYPPFENLENGEYVGFEIELCEALAAEMGLQVEFVPMQFDAIVPAIAAGGQADIGASGFSVTPERAEQINFTSTFYVDDQAVAVMGDSPLASDTSALNSADVTIAVQSGTTGESYARENYPNATIQPYGNSTDAFAAMQAGQADAVCTNMAVVNKMIATAYNDAVVVATSATGEEYAMVVSQDNEALLAAVNDALATLQANGTIDQLLETWM